jgi:hypothetical protein
MPDQYIQSLAEMITVQIAQIRINHNRDNFQGTPSASQYMRLEWMLIAIRQSVRSGPEADIAMNQKPSLMQFPYLGLEVPRGTIEISLSAFEFLSFSRE